MKYTKHTLTALLLVLIASISTYSQIKTVEPEKAIEQTIAAGAAHSYIMTLPAGMYGAIGLDQKGLNLVLTIFAADGQPLRTADQASVGKYEEISIFFFVFFFFF